MYQKVNAIYDTFDNSFYNLMIRIAIPETLGITIFSKWLFPYQMVYLIIHIQVVKIII